MPSPLFCRGEPLYQKGKAGVVEVWNILSICGADFCSETDDVPRAKSFSVAKGIAMLRPVVQGYVNQFQLTDVACSGQCYRQK